MYRENQTGFNNYKQYGNYWSSTKSQRASTGRSSSESLEAVSKYKWQLLVIIMAVIIAVLFAVTLYFAVSCSGKSDTGSTGYTGPLCKSGFIRYGDDLDPMEENSVMVGIVTNFVDASAISEVYSFYYWGQLSLMEGMTADGFDIYLFDTHLVRNNEGRTYYHEVTSKEELDVIRCLTESDNVEKAYVFTWVNMTRLDTNQLIGSFQGVIALSNGNEVYLIRNYGDDLPLTDENYLFTIFFNLTALEDDILPSDVVGRRLVTRLDHSNLETKNTTRFNVNCNC